MPFTQFTPPPAPTQQDWSQHMDPVSTPDIGGYFGPRTGPSPKRLRRLFVFGVGIAAGKAAKNHYDLNQQPYSYYHEPSNSDTSPVGRVIDAAEVGAEAFARLMLWLGALATNCFCLVWYSLMVYAYFNSDQPVSENAAIVHSVAVLGILFLWPRTIGVTWCRNVDFCLFRRGMWYKLFQRFDTPALENLSLWFLYLLVFMPFAWAALELVSLVKGGNVF